MAATLRVARDLHFQGWMALILQVAQDLHLCARRHLYFGFHRTYSSGLGWHLYPRLVQHLYSSGTYIILVPLLFLINSYYLLSFFIIATLQYTCYCSIDLLLSQFYMGAYYKKLFFDQLSVKKQLVPKIKERLLTLAATQSCYDLIVQYATCWTQQAWLSSN